MTKNIVRPSALGLIALAVSTWACGGGTSDTQGQSAGGTSAVSSGGAPGAPSGGSPALPGAGGTPSNPVGGASAGGASAGGTTAAAGASTGGSTGGTVASSGAGPVPSCADPTPTGSLDIPNVGTAPGAITYADLKDGSTTVMNYAMSVPGNLPPAGTTDPAKQIGLFLTFHEHSGNTPDEIASVTKSLANLKHSGDFVVLGVPVEVAGSGYTQADHDRTKKLLAFALQNWPINPRRVYLWARGAGATMADTWGPENKTSVAATITYSWGSEQLASNAANDLPDLYIVIGLADYPDSHVPLVRRVYQAAKKAQYNVIYREVPGLKGDTSNAPTNDDAVNWAISSRHKTQPLAAAEQALLAPYADVGQAERICPNATTFANFVLVGGTQAGHYVPGVLGAGAAASRSLAAQICGRANFGNEADTALAALLGDTSSDVRKQAITALGQVADWRNQAAQKALITLATTATADSTERGLAVDAIGVAVKFQIGGAVDTGGYQDPPLFQALVTLLGDSDATLRSKAFTILKPAMTSTYDPTAAPASQQTAITAWQTWVGTLKG